MLPKIGPVELSLILVIVVMLFGVGRLPEVFGAVGRGLREFRNNVKDADTNTAVTPTEDAADETVNPAAPTTSAAASAPTNPASPTTPTTQI